MVNNKRKREEKRKKLNTWQSIVGVLVIVLALIQFWNMGEIPFLLPLLLLLGSGFSVIGAGGLWVDRKKALAAGAGSIAALLFVFAVIGFFVL